MRILITGATGFIGTSIIGNITNGGDKILALSRNTLHIRTPSNINWLKADLADPLSYREAVQSFRPEVVIHLAWDGIPDFSLQRSTSNLTQSIEFLSFIFNLGCCQKVVVSGSCFEFNKLNGVCSESEVGSAKDSFTWAKHSLRNWLEIECLKQDIRLAWMRIFYVYGPGQRSASLIPTILKCLKEGKVPELMTPKNASDFIFVSDIAKAFTNAVYGDFPSGIYNLGSEQSTSVLEVCRISELIVSGSDAITNELKIRASNMGSAVNFWANCDKSNEFFGVQKKIGLHEGIAETWKWIRKKDLDQPRQ